MAKKKEELVAEELATVETVAEDAIEWTPVEMTEEEQKDVMEAIADTMTETPEPVEEKRFAEINGKKYYLDSDNTDLLEDVAWGKKKNEAGQWEDQTFKYLPAKHIYTLMDSLFDTYDFKSEPAKYVWEEYSTTKKKYNNQTKKWEDVEETSRVYEKSVRIVTTIKISEYENVVRETVGYAQWVASLSILTNDSARNWFMNKLAFRARKEALKNLGKVFRTYEYWEDEDIFEAEETTSVAGKSIAEVTKAFNNAPKNTEVKQSIIDKIKVIKDFFSDGAEFTEDELTKVLFAVKSDMNITADKKDLMEAFKEIYTELKAKVKK